MNQVLVVDDSAVDRRLVGGLLEKAGMRVSCAVNGADALQHMQQSLPDLVVTDLVMPEMDGLELVTTIRSRYPLVPTVLMTSQGNEDIAVEALRRGAASYVPKRAVGPELLETVRNVLALSSQQRIQSRLMQCMEHMQFRFVLGNDRQLLSSLVVYLQDAAAQLRLCDEANRMRIGVALEEALVNALYHGNLEVSSELRERDYDSYQALAEQRVSLAPYRERRIFVESSMTPAEARFVIRDEGNGFNPAELPDPTDPANLERVSGRGVLLMRTFMDEVSFNTRGNEVTLVKLRDGNSCCM
jgi:CheY-like chemotaxis protein/anti-sigma regulatory factor (Ser/Thr protein kinase)